MNGLSRKRQAGAIEVTPAMIEAGVAAYEKWKPEDFDWQYTEPQMVESVLRAALGALTE